MALKLSLCVICGNESTLIERLLSTFSPAFDEFSLVRAIGAQEPDDTATKARKWCDDHDKEFVFSEHKNDPLAAKWTHIDDFAAARQKSFAQATGAWRFWGDCDDVGPANIGLLREIAAGAPAACDMFRFPYDVPGTGKCPQRERLVRGSTFDSGKIAWMFPVHENLRYTGEGYNAQEKAFPIWKHHPTNQNANNRARNILILSRKLADTATYYFYVHQEHMAQGNLMNAQKFGELALQFPMRDLEQSFRHEIYLNLCRIEKDKRKAVQYAMDAHSVFPWCRESIASLVMLYFELNEPDRVDHWAKRLLATPEPPPERRPWTHEAKWYGWAGRDLAARAARFTGNLEEGRKQQQAVFNGGAPIFSLIHATRGRAQKAVNCRDLWLALAEDPSRVEHIFGVDADDKHTMMMVPQFQHALSTSPNCVSAWNEAAKLSQGAILIQISDDWVPPMFWDRYLLESIGKKDPMSEAFVVAISDGHRKDELLCMAIMSRQRWRDQRREMFSSEYEGVYSDNEFSYRAWTDKVVIDMRTKIEFRHDHPFFTPGAPLDETYNRQNAITRYVSGWETFVRRNPDAPKPPHPQPEAAMARVEIKMGPQ